MKEFLRKSIYTAEKTIVVMCIITALGLVGNGNLSLETFRQIFIYSALLGFYIGGTTIIFDAERLNIKLKYLIHFISGYAALNILEGVIFEGTFLPSSQPINYLYKLIIYLAAYSIVTAVDIYNEKRLAKKMADRINEIKAE